MIPRRVRERESEGRRVRGGERRKKSTGEREVECKESICTTQQTTG